MLVSKEVSVGDVVQDNVLDGWDGEMLPHVCGMCEAAVTEVELEEYEVQASLDEWESMGT